MFDIQKLGYGIVHIFIKFTEPISVVITMNLVFNTRPDKIKIVYTAYGEIITLLILTVP